MLFNPTLFIASRSMNQGPSYGIKRFLLNGHHQASVAIPQPKPFLHGALTGSATSFRERISCLAIASPVDAGTD